MHETGFLRLAGIVPLLGLLCLAGCFTGAGMPAGGDFVCGAKVVEAKLSGDWYYLGLEGGEIRSLHQDDTVFLESVTGSLYRQPRGAAQPDMAIYFSLKPNFSVGSVSNRGKVEQAGWLHAKLQREVEALGGEYRRMVPSPDDRASLKEYGKAPVYTPSGMSKVSALQGSKYGLRERFNRFPRALHVEGRAEVGRGFLCWTGDGSYRISVYEFKDARRYYQVYVVVPETEYETAMPAAMDFLTKITFREPKF